MVNPIRNRAPLNMGGEPKKKKIKEVDVRVKKATEKVRTTVGLKGDGEKTIAKRVLKEGVIAGGRAALAASSRILASRQAGVKAQKSAFLAQRAHMAQQLMAAKRAAAAEKMKKRKIQSKEEAKRKEAFKKVNAYFKSNK